jgi:transcriptional antiterminator RfaH
MIADRVSNWYVVQTHSSAERKAMMHLNHQGFATYLPCCAKSRRHARKVENGVSPLFPNYLFVALDTRKDRWRCIQSTIGVVRLVCNGEKPAAVPDGLVEDLKAQQDAQGLIPVAACPRFSPGDKVLVARGAFSCCLGLFESFSGSERVAILLDLLGRKVRVMIGVDDLAAT